VSIGLLSAFFGRLSQQFLAALAVLFCFLSPMSPGASAQSLDKLEIVTASGVHTFSVELASNDAEREKGLMYRRFMPADRGMLFDFKREEPVMFWMKNTYIPLDMIFMSKTGKDVGIVANAKPMSEQILSVLTPTDSVLELNGGVAAKIGVKVGDMVKDPIFSP
jgi:uncharacterized membrane protein (UPF0127 family)